MKFLIKYLKFMFSNTKTKYRTILLVLFFNTIISVLTIVFAYMSKNIIDKVFVDKDVNYIYFVAKILIITYIFYFFIELIGMYYTSIWKINIEFDIKKKFYSNIQNILYKELRNISNTSLYHRLFSDGSIISEYFYTILIVIPFNFIYVILILSIMLKWSKILTLYSLLLIVGEFINIIVAKKPIVSVINKQKDIDQKLVNFVVEKIELIFFSQIMNLRKKWARDVDEKFEESKIYTIKNFFFMSIFNQSSSLLNQIWALGLLLLGANLIIKSKITIGVFVGFQSLLGYMIQPFSILVNSLMAYQNNKVSFRRFIEYYELPKIQNNEGMDSFKFNSDVIFQNLFFSYENGKTILNNFNATFLKGEIVVISGDSGSGKTTLMNLFLRLFEPKVGTIKIDGVDIKNIKFDEYMDNITFMTQEPTILNDSLRNNLTLYKDISDEEIYDLLRHLNLEYIIKNTNYNLDSFICERDMRLSIGEAQRISLGRAFLRCGSIIYLDEPTSSIDKESEKVIINFIKQYCKKNNVLIIINSHSKEILEIGDKIIYL